jgi:hypothetical protein
LGKIFDDLCKGPIIVVDDMIGTNKDPIDKLIAELESNRLPVLKYKTLIDIRNSLAGFCFCNFVILDWKMIGGEDMPPGVQVGAEAEDSSEHDVINLIKEIQKISLAPIFLFSNLNTDPICSKLEIAGISVKGRTSVFVERKSLCETEGALVSKIEQWIKENPHIYLAKWWINEWLSKNTNLFWELYKLNPNWPVAFYHSFKEDGVHPILALRDTLLQMVFSDIDVGFLDASLLDIEIGESNSESLKNLYRRLVYTTNNIDSDIRPGDIFRLKEKGKEKFTYYINIRPECDTTKRSTHEDPELYLLEGHPIKPKSLQERYEGPKYGIIPWENEIIMIQLDGNDFVKFDKKKLLLKHVSEMASFKKICRVVPPFITQIRQSYANYLARFGVPSYPTEFVDLLFSRSQDSSDTET